MSTSEYHDSLKILCLLGFVLVGVGTLTAYLNPARGYELSPYAATPVLFWIAITTALILSVVVVFATGDRQTRIAGGFLGGVSMTAIVSLPLIRGYHFFGQTDSLSHLGTAIDINAGSMAMTENRYPMVHTIGSVLHDATGFTMEHTLLLVVVVFVVCFFTFIPVVIQELAANTEMVYIGLFAGLLLLPINQLSPSLYIHPTSQAIMYAPVFLVAFYSIVRHRTVWNSALFLVIASMVVLLHPQQAANLLLFSGVIAVAQIVNDFYTGARLQRWRQWIVPEVVAFATVFWLWVRNLPAFWRTYRDIYTIPFRDTQAAETTATRSLSLTQVGGSLPEVFLKLFFVSVLFVLLTAFFIFEVTVRTNIGQNIRTRTAEYTPDGGTIRRNYFQIILGFLAVTALFGLYLIGGISDQYFRQLGMLMVFATIFGSIALGWIWSRADGVVSVETARLSVGIFLLLCLVISIPVVFASPYMYYASDQVTEQQMEGFERSFEYQSPSIGYDDVRSSTSRYGNAILGREIPSEAYYQMDEPGIPDHFVYQSLPAYFDEPTYVPVTEADRIRDPVLWKGFRFSHEDFAYLDAEPGINRVQSNGGYDLYLVRCPAGSGEHREQFSQFEQSGCE